MTGVGGSESSQSEEDNSEGSRNMRSSEGQAVGRAGVLKWEYKLTSCV